MLNLNGFVCSPGRARGASGVGGELEQAHGQSGPGTSWGQNHTHSSGAGLYSRSHSYENYQVNFLTGF